jgi:hypothetical protein
VDAEEVFVVVGDDPGCVQEIAGVGFVVANDGLQLAVAGCGVMEEVEAGEAGNGGEGGDAFGVALEPSTNFPPASGSRRCSEVFKFSNATATGCSKTAPS